VNIHSYTIAKSYPAPPPVKGDMDARYARRVAEKLGIQYTIMGNINALYEKYFIEQVKQLDGLCYEHIWAFPLVEKISDELINFDGIGGDVIMKGGIFLDTDTYREQDLLNKNNLKSYNDNKLAEVLHNKMRRFSNIEYHAIIPFFKKEVSSKLLSDKTSVFEEIKKLRSYEQKIQVFQMKNRTRNAVSLTANNIFMRKTYSLLPICDNEFVEFALSIPIDMKIKNQIYKKILKKTFPEIMHIPTTNNPKDIKKRMKSALLVSRMDWLRYSLGDIAKLLKKLRSTKIEKLKLSQNPRDVKYLIWLAHNIEIPDMITKEQLLEQIDYHLKNDIDPSYFLEPILQFIVWHHLFVQK
jgi:asparagine synthetase B (glutamine-hydrolysing)